MTEIPKRNYLVWGIILLVVVCITLYSKINNSQQPESPSKGYQQSEQPSEDNKALKAILAEPKVKDGVITDAGVLYASVLDDGTRRDGYAEYLCLVLKDYKTSVTRVKVVKYN